MKLIVLITGSLETTDMLLCITQYFKYSPTEISHSAFFPNLPLSLAWSFAFIAVLGKWTVCKPTSIIKHHVPLLTMHQ